ncbi:MAG: tetratricopeptide repeat protein [Planctomycetaceae bacterium]|nr:tetratricopeptide repeat protein [Planctomycetaceae bacterium]
MEIKNIKFEISGCIGILTICLAFFVSVSAAEEFEPLDVLDANFQTVVDMNMVPLDFLSIAQANLLTKMDGSSDLRSQLKQVIDRINSVQFKSKEQADRDAAVSSDIAVAENAAKQDKEAKDFPKTIIPDASVSQDSQKNMNITEQTSRMIEQSIQQPQSVKNPLELADILYNCGRLKDAAVFYQQALEDSNEINDVMYKDKAWILFQAGNCLQKIEPQTAVKMYKRLIAEYSDSTWAQAAGAKSNLIEWYLQQKPDALLKKAK